MLGGPLRWYVAPTGRMLHARRCILIWDHSGAGKRGVEALSRRQANAWLDASPAGRGLCAKCQPADPRLAAAG